VNGNGNGGSVAVPEPVSSELREGKG
jgi:hypothetical protein